MKNVSFGLPEWIEMSLLIILPNLTCGDAVGELFLYHERENKVLRNTFQVKNLSLYGMCNVTNLK